MTTHYYCYFPFESVYEAKKNRKNPERCRPDICDKYGGLQAWSQFKEICKSRIMIKVKEEAEEKGKMILPDIPYKRTPIANTNDPFPPAIYYETKKEYNKMQRRVLKYMRQGKKSWKNLVQINKAIHGNIRGTSMLLKDMRKKSLLKTGTPKQNLEIYYILPERI